MRIPKEVATITTKEVYSNDIIDALVAYGFIVVEVNCSNYFSKQFMIAKVEEGDEE